MVGLHPSVPKQTSTAVTGSKGGAKTTSPIQSVIEKSKDRLYLNQKLLIYKNVTIILPGSHLQTEQMHCMATRLY